MAKKLSKSKTTAASKKSYSFGGELLRKLDNANEKYKFERYLPILSVLVLFATSIYWSLQSLFIQKNNADQLINPYLFDSVDVARHAIYPSAHTFLFKWPLFMIIRLFDYSQMAYFGVSLTVVLLTIAGFVYLLYRIEKRPLYFATLCLALASVLLMIPANPYSGALLPVNMAMLATRNLEYLLFLGGLILLIKSKKLFDRNFLLAILVMVMLFASDRLFLLLSLGGAVLTLAVFAILRFWRLVNLAGQWLLCSVIAAFVAATLLAAINWTGLAIINGGASGGPYGLAGSFKDFALGIFYAFSGILTNFGANPAFDATTIKSVVDTASQRIFTLGGFTYVINLAIFGAGLGAVWLIAIKPLTSKKQNNVPLSQSLKLVYLLLATSLTALAMFVLTDHYYAVDSRYLSVTLFTIFVSLAAAFNKQRLEAYKLLAADAALFVAIICAIFASHSVANLQNSAYADIRERNQTIAKVLASKPVNTLVGDYWRVVPIKNSARHQLKVSPLADCTTQRNSLTSGAWYPDLNKQSFAYLLSFDKSLSDFPKCSLEQVIKAYGRPNSSVVVDGTLDNPKELLLYYDHGTHKKTNQKTLSQQASTIFPINADDLTGTVCSVPTVMNVVAHQDDDLLFINPDTISDINAGSCVRTVYLTAGDAGHSDYYWLSRQRGSEAAYSYMAGNKQDIWIEKTVKLANNQYISVASPKGNPKTALIFLHLPDGNLNGEGFGATGQQSLGKLISSKEQTISSIDGQSRYNYGDLIGALNQIMQIYQPTELRTQSAERGSEYPDHSDHNSAGVLASAAFREFQQQRFGGKISLPITYYSGYPIHAMAPNLSPEQVKQKTLAFLAYAKYDGSVCKSREKCLQHSNYAMYVERQYQVNQ